MKFDHEDYTIIHQLAFMSPDRVMASGSFSWVFDSHLKKNTVLKINHEFDPTYYYLEWAMNEPAPWKPKVHYLQMFRNSSNHRIGYAAVMKKYKTISYGKMNAHAREIDDYEEQIDEWVAQSKLQRKFKRTVQFDIAKRNIMLDGNQIIITDPLYV